MKEITVENCAEIIVSQYLHRRSLSNPYLDELDGLSWPGIVLAPSGREVLFDKTISSAAQDLADLLRRDVWSIGYYEWLNLVRESVAYALGSKPNQMVDFA